MRFRHILSRWYGCCCGIYPLNFFSPRLLTQWRSLLAAWELFVTNRRRLISRNHKRPPAHSLSIDSPPHIIAYLDCGVIYAAVLCVLLRSPSACRAIRKARSQTPIGLLGPDGFLASWLTQNVPGTFMLLANVGVKLVCHHCWHESTQSPSLHPPSDKVWWPWDGYRPLGES